MAAARSEESDPGAPEPVPREDLLRALAEIGDAAELVSEPALLSLRALEAALAATGAQGGSLLVWDARSAELRMGAAVGLDRTRWSEVRVRPGVGVAGDVAQARRPLCLRGAIEPGRFVGATPRAGIAASLVAPLLHGEELAGVLCLHHGTHAEHFCEADLPFAEGLGRVLGRLLGLAERAARARRAESALAAADEARRVLEMSRPLPERLATLCRAAARRAGHGLATLWLRDAAGDDRLALAATSSAGGAMAGGARLAPGEGLDGRAARDGVPIRLHRDGRLAYAALPLLASGARVGVLSVQGGEGEIDEDALDALVEAAARELARQARDEREEARLAHSEALHETGLRLLSLPDAPAVAQAAAAAAVWLADAEQAVVRLRTAEGTRFEVRGLAGAGDGEERAALLALDARAAREALRRHGAVSTVDLGAGESGAPLPPLVVLPFPGARGTLGVYGRRADGDAPGAFGVEQRQLLERIAAYAGHAIARAPKVPGSRPPPVAEVESRLDAALARPGPRAFAVAACWIDNAEALRAAGGLDAAMRRTEEGLRTHLGERDAIERRGHAFLALLPELGAAPEERIARLARAVAEHVAKDETLNEPVRVALAFGYALPGGAVETRDALLARAQVPRIRML